jgi:nitrogen regulatory protein P-II 2
MKLIIAYVQPEKLTAVKEALAARNIGKMSVTNALGCGQQKGFHEHYRGADIEINLLKKVRFEIAIIQAARTGNIGDGKIFVTPLEDCIRIRTGERGTSAIG